MQVQSRTRTKSKATKFKRLCQIRQCRLGKQRHTEVVKSAFVRVELPQANLAAECAIHVPRGCTDCVGHAVEARSAVRRGDKIGQLIAAHGCGKMQIARQFGIFADVDISAPSTGCIVAAERTFFAVCADEAIIAEKARRCLCKPVPDTADQNAAGGGVPEKINLNAEVLAREGSRQRIGQKSRSARALRFQCAVLHTPVSLRLQPGQRICR